MPALYSWKNPPQYAQSFHLQYVMYHLRYLLAVLSIPLMLKTYPAPTNPSLMARLSSPASHLHFYAPECSFPMPGSSRDNQSDNVLHGSPYAPERLQLSPPRSSTYPVLPGTIATDFYLQQLASTPYLVISSVLHEPSIIAQH